jgi:hypothetical protein
MPPLAPSPACLGGTPIRALPQSGPDKALYLSATIVALLWLAAEARTLTDTLVGMPDRVHLFSQEGQFKVFVDGEVRTLSAERLHKVIRANCVTKHIVNRESTLEIEFRPAEANTMMLRTVNGLTA